VTSLIVGPLAANFPPSYFPILGDAIPNGRFNPRTIPQFLIKNQVITGDPNRPECHPSQQKPKPINFSEFARHPISEQRLLHIKQIVLRRGIPIAKNLQNFKREDPSLFGLATLPEPMKYAFGNTSIANQT
jgi:hypothetical protein